MLSHIKSTANLFARLKSSSNQAVIYSDGVVLRLAVPSGTQEIIERALGESVTTTARSDDDRCGIVVLRLEGWQRALDMVGECIPLAVVDNRKTSEITVSKFLENTASTKR